jgi:hypothetical protein
MTKANTIRSMLAEGRSPLSRGRAADVAALIFAQPRKAAQLTQCLWDEDPGVVNRAADALERASFHLPSILKPWQAPLLGLLAEAQLKKLRWNLALIVSRLELTIPESGRAAAILQSWLDDESSIVKTCAMHGLADLTRQNSSLLPDVLDQIRILTRTGTPAVRARGRILLKRMENTSEK